MEGIRVSWIKLCFLLSWSVQCPTQPSFTPCKRNWSSVLAISYSWVNSLLFPSWVISDCVLSIEGLLYSSTVSSILFVLSCSCVVTAPFVSFVVQKGYLYDTNSLVGLDRKLL